MHFTQAHNIEDLRRAARQRLPHAVFQWMDGGTEDDATLNRNREAFGDYRFVPRALVDVSGRSQMVKLFGVPHRSPFGLAPTGAAGIYAHRADIALARAARDAGVPFVLSTASFDKLEDVAREAAGGTLWFQLYMSKNRESARKLVVRALEAGFSALVVTADVAVIGAREYNKRNNFGVPFKLTLRNMVDGVLHPRWLCGVFLKTLLDTGVPRYRNDDSQNGNKVIAAPVLSFQAGRDALDWDDLRWLRELWPHQLFVKGLAHVDDARKALEMGADGVILSNHGGRQLDAAVAPLDVLPEMRAALGKEAVIMIDGGIRRGGDVVKALALGADFVFTGRATLYGLAAGGQAGVAHALGLLRGEVDRVLALLGCRGVDELGGGCLRKTR